LCYFINHYIVGVHVCLSLFVIHVLDLSAFELNLYHCNSPPMCQELYSKWLCHWILTPILLKQRQPSSVSPRTQKEKESPLEHSFGIVGVHVCLSLFVIHVLDLSAFELNLYHCNCVKEWILWVGDQIIKIFFNTFTDAVSACPIQFKSWQIQNMDDKQR
jgi:hypothetical protein